MTITDYMPTNPLMHQAWVDCLRWATGEPEIQKQFLNDTGLVLTAIRTPLDRMVDQATGRDADIGERFVKWFNVNIWGEVNGCACNGDEPELESE